MENADLVKMMFQCFLSVYSEIPICRDDIKFKFREVRGASRWID